MKVCLPLTHLFSSTRVVIFPYITQHVCLQTSPIIKSCFQNQKKSNSERYTLLPILSLIISCDHTPKMLKINKQCLMIIALLVASTLVSEAARFPNWEQMLPKKLPSPSSSPSKGTNSVSTSSSSKAVVVDTRLPSSSDGKV